MQGRLLTIDRLTDCLKRRFDCTVEFFPSGAIGTDDEGMPSLPLYGFTRKIPGREHPKLATIVVQHDVWPLLHHNVRSLLARLDITLDEFLERLDFQ